MDKQELFQLPVPQSTDSYSAVSHQQVDELVQEHIYKRNMQISDEKIMSNNNGNVVVGYYDITNEHQDFGYRIAWQNSYNKTRPVTFVGGTYVFVCSNGMILGDYNFVRKHTGGIAQELSKRIGDSFIGLDELLEESVDLKQEMIDVKIDKTATAELCGRLLMEHEVITTSQLSIIREQYKNPSYPNSFESGTFWELYNNTTHALKKTHPYNYLQKHSELLQFAEVEVL